MTWVPVPLRATLGFGFTLALVLMFTVAARGPAAAGLRLTVMMQFPPATKPAPPIGQLLLSTKSPGFVPVSETLLIVKGTLPVLNSVTV